MALLRCQPDSVASRVGGNEKSEENYKNEINNQSHRDIPIPRVIRNYQPHYPQRAPSRIYHVSYFDVWVFHSFSGHADVGL